MAEGMLGGILGKDDDKPETEGPAALAGAEAFASAVAAKLAGNDPEVARDTSAFLKKQAQLLEIQAEHLKDEHALRLAHLHHELGEENIRRFGLRLRVGFQVFFALFATVIGIGLAVMIYNAVHSRSVVIDPFEAPPATAAAGISGRVVASGLLDRLVQMQTATRSEIQKRKISDAWSNEISLELPQTGLSISAIERVLKTRFGHDQHISGDLVKIDPTGLALTVRGTGVLPKTFFDAKGELDALTSKAAEYVYSQAQPALWAVYLVDSGRYREAIEFCQVSTASSSTSDRPVLFTYWAVAIAKSLGVGPLALNLAERPVALKPDYWVGYTDLMNVKLLLGDEEAVWKLGEKVRKMAGGRPGRAPEVTYIDSDLAVWDLQAQLGGLLADAESTSGGTFTFATGPEIASFEALLHDPVAADIALQTTKPDTDDPQIAAGTRWVRGLLAADSGDPERAVSEMDAFLAAYSNPAVVWVWAGFNCWAAPAEEAAGHPDKADVILKTGGTFVDCYRFRGDILDHRGDWPAAQKAYADAVALAPDLPAGYYSWGVALAKHRELDGAVAKLKDANLKGPHWADPLKAWGDVLAKQGKTTEALVKYEEALKYAPNWKQLKQAHEAIAKQKS
jgi:tetratricopeptide (TPR) repeat protein